MRQLLSRFVPQDPVDFVVSGIFFFSFIISIAAIVAFAVLFRWVLT